MDLLREAVRASAGARARPGAAPSSERLQELARLVAAGRYRVDPRSLAEILIVSAPGRARRPG